MCLVSRCGHDISRGYRHRGQCRAQRSGGRSLAQLGLLQWLCCHFGVSVPIRVGVVLNKYLVAQKKKCMKGVYTLRYECPGM